MIILLPLKVLAVGILLVLLRGVVWLLNLLFLLPLSDPLQHLPGPDGSRLQSHFNQVMNPELTPEMNENWSKKYGKSFRFHGFGKHDYRLMSFDFRVITHVLNSPALYERPWQTRDFLATLFGRGIFSTEGAERKLQRKLLGPAFATQSIKAMSPVFIQKAEELCDLWRRCISEASSETTGTTSTSASQNIDVSHWLSRASFDVIGLAGFDYNFHALKGESERAYKAYRNVLRVAEKGLSFRGIVELYFPILRKLLPNNDVRSTNRSLRVIKDIGRTLVENKTAKIRIEEDKSEELEEKDILSLLIKSNISMDCAKQLPDSDLLDQSSTLMLAGSDTVSLAVAWCLFQLSQHPSVQTRLREEIHTIAHLHSTCTTSAEASCPEVSEALPKQLASASFEAIESLPYLDAVVRETLRLSPPVHGTIRVATANDQIPISHPVTLRDGTILEAGSSISIRKGSYIHIPIEGINYSKEIWGDDALSFKPDRWSNPPTKVPGLGNTMTFGFGSHACLGYKFSVFEIKVFLCTILPRFTFAPMENTNISKFSSIVTRPYVVERREQGSQLPLKVALFHS
ncbi:cytochrome P450 [Crucibulum laeve]|uniref:Cytochrome P450 n=1 Tax=Crucibulum laeve TaxID=68775 RepID=A0A5C3M6E3_9AGAR|nr:cytochrome P450 [Crucibulum laeve]